MRYDEWQVSVPEEIKGDPLWKLEVYRLGLLHEIQQDSSRSTANVEHRLTEFFDISKIKETIFPGGSVAAEQVPEFRHEAVVFVGGGCHKSPIVSGKWVMGWC